MILGIDPGSVRVGIAIADDETRFARPLEVVDRRSTDPIARIAQLVAEHGVTRIVVGRPVHLSGAAGTAVTESEAFVAELTAAVSVPVDEHDERLTTVVAEQGLRAGGAKAKDRRAMRDAVAAQVLLQGYLDLHASRSGEGER